MTGINEVHMDHLTQTSFTLRPINVDDINGYSSMAVLNPRSTNRPTAEQPEESQSRLARRRHGQNRLGHFSRESRSVYAIVEASAKKVAFIVAPIAVKLGPR